MGNDNKDKMKPELTAIEHGELLGDEISHNDLMAMAVWADVEVNGKDKQIALRDHGISEAFYDVWGIKRSVRWDGGEKIDNVLGY